MTRTPLRLLLLGSLLAFVFVVSACGSDDNSSSSKSSSSSTTPSLEGKKGGVLKQLGASDVDFLDPGKTYYTGGYQQAYATNRPLYNFKPGQVDPVPDLADGPAQISKDQKTVTIKIKEGVKFGPPVNRAVACADVKYAFERFMSKQVQLSTPATSPRSWAGRTSRRTA